MNEKIPLETREALHHEDFSEKIRVEEQPLHNSSSREQNQHPSQTKETASFSSEEKEAVAKKQYAHLNPHERQHYIDNHAPALGPESFATPDGRMLDFSAAHDIEELIGMIRQEKVIENGVGQHVPSEKVINIIYDRLLNRNNPNYDWTKITLRHRLRETVYRLAENYVNQKEFLTLEGLHLETIHSLNELTDAVRTYKHIIDTTGNIVSGATMAHYIEIGKYGLVPPPLRYKAQSFLNDHKQKTPTTWKQKLSGVLNWFRR